MMARNDLKNFFYILKQVDCYRPTCNKSRILTPKGVYIKDENDNFIFNKEFDKKHRSLYKLGLQIPCECCRNIESVIKFYSDYVYKSTIMGTNPEPLYASRTYWFCGPFGFDGFLAIYKKIESKQELLNEFIKFEDYASKYNRVFFKKYLNLKYQNKIINAAKTIYNKDYMFGSEAEIRIKNHKLFIDFIINTLKNDFNKNIFASNENEEIINAASDTEKQILSKLYKDSNYYIKYSLINIINNKFKQHIFIYFPVETGIYNKYRRKVHDCFNIRIFHYDNNNDWMYEFGSTIRLKENENNIKIQNFYSEYDVIKLIQGLIWILTFQPIDI
jgi:hypothetical protein